MVKRRTAGEYGPEGAGNLVSGRNHQRSTWNLETSRSEKKTQIQRHTRPNKEDASPQGRIAWCERKIDASGTAKLQGRTLRVILAPRSGMNEE